MKPEMSQDLMTKLTQATDTWQLWNLSFSTHKSGLWLVSVSIRLKIHLRGRNYWNYLSQDVLIVKADHQENTSRVCSKTSALQKYSQMTLRKCINSDLRRFRWLCLNNKKMKSNPDKCKIMQETPKVTREIIASEWEFGVMVSQRICQYSIDQ